MLTGRESLVRLIGKRRRFLPNRQSLLSTPIPASFDLRSGDENGRLTATASEGKLKEVEEEVVGGGSAAEAEEKLSDWVNCPVCGIQVRGDDYRINAHLDACLSRGTKRKLTQRTLLQLNFCSQLTARTPSGELEKERTNGGCASPAENIVETTVIGFRSSGEVDESDSSSCKSTSTTQTVVETGLDGLIGISSDGDKIAIPVDTSALSIDNELAKNDVAVTVDDISGVILETFIVGRKFSDEKELNPWDGISLLRDPDNPKDPNAIKVALADSKSSKVLGFLPRELAQYLSPLIDKHSLTFVGHVTSVPKHHLDIVPVEIMCSKVTLHADEDTTNINSLTLMWKNVLHVVKSAKNYLPSSKRYQRNFCLLLQEVLRSNSHLFTNEEKHFMESFFSLLDDSQRLFVRLYMRKGPWFRMSNILYPEVMDPQQAIKELSASGFMHCIQDTNELQDSDAKEILHLLRIFELREIASMFKKNPPHGTRKQDLAASLFASYKDRLCPHLPNAILGRTGTCIKISSKAESLIWRAERLFFLNGEQNLSAFLLVDLGIVKYPSYQCIMLDPIFSNQSELLAYEEAIEVAQIMDESLDENYNGAVLRCIEIAESRMSSSPAKSNQSTVSESMVSFRSCFSASWVYSKVVLLGISFLEHERRYKDAIKLLKRLRNCFTCNGRRGYWTLRLSIDLERIGCPNESLSVAEDGLLDPWVRAGARMALQRRVLRLGKPPRRWKVPSFSESIKREIREVHIQGRPLNCETGMKSKFYGEDGEQCGVEQLALHYYAGEGGGWHGVHTESGIWLTIFGLLLWDIIFSDVPDVFHNRFQSAPLDLETDSFYVVRKGIIESQLQKIHNGMAEEILITSWELHSGKACRGVNWDQHSLSELRAAVNCIGGPCLASLCRHLAQDYRSWSSGMPDLLLWRFHGDYKGEAKLVEVKGPRDCLSEQQRAWLLLLMDCGFNAEVCKVSPVALSSPRVHAAVRDK